MTKKNKLYDRNKELKKDALRKSRCIQKDLNRVKSISEKRLERLDISTIKVSKLQSMLNENKSKLHQNQVKRGSWLELVTDIQKCSPYLCHSYIRNSLVRDVMFGMSGILRKVGKS